MTNLNFIKLAAALCFSFAASSASAATLTNADFQTDTLDGWTISSINGGSSSASGVGDFDTSGSGTSAAAAFNVGAESFGNLGGISFAQDFEVGAAGLYDFSANIAIATGFFFGTQTSPGFFDLVVNGNVLDSVDFGTIGANEEKRDTLMGTADLAVGTNTIAIQITRNGVFSSVTPIQYIDNVTATAVAPVPLPAGLPLMLVGLGAIAVARRRRQPV